MKSGVLIDQPPFSVSATAVGDIEYIEYAPNKVLRNMGGPGDSQSEREPSC